MEYSESFGPFFKSAFCSHEEVVKAPTSLRRIDIILRSKLMSVIADFVLSAGDTPCASLLNTAACIMTASSKSEDFEYYTRVKMKWLRVEGGQIV